MLLTLMGVLAATASPAPFDWGALIASAVGGSGTATVLGWQLWRSNRDNDRKDALLAANHERELALAERLATVLVDATRTMVDVQRAMEASNAQQRRRGA